ncbi:hypothetical protein ACI3L3_05100 [Desulfobaculum sp. SPO524]|uniref:hypothetical protein n=1 Tax=Desulfobaculum sp. SPO524 TaxID=3378071 RepID=UPI003853E035
MRARTKQLLLLIVTCLTLGACSVEGRQAVDFLWPDLNDPYVAATRTWSRSQTLYDGVNAEFTAVATLASSDWREAYAQRYGEVYGLTPQEQQDFLDDQMRAHERETTFIVAVSGAKRELTRLAPRLKTWRITVQNDGRTVLPQEVRPLQEEDWSSERLAAFFPHHTRWQKYYFIRFEPLSAGPVRLMVSGPAGRVAFDWQNYK